MNYGLILYNNHYEVLFIVVKMLKTSDFFPSLKALKNSQNLFIIRDAGNIDACPCVILIGAGVEPRCLNCGLCGVKDCAAAKDGGISCAMAVHDLGIAVGSAAATAMDHRIDNRVLFTAGMAALKLRLFSDNVKICFGIGLSATGKNIFFDRRATGV